MDLGEKTQEFAPDAGSHILVVEDDVPLADLLRQKLEAQSYVVEVAHDGEQARQAVNRKRYNLLILDLNLPKIDGVSLLQQMRPSQPRLPVLVLTARNRIEDRVLSLDTGADDILNKPFSMVELFARVRALLRRNDGQRSQVSQVADLVLDRKEWSARRNGRPISLTAREFHLLEFFMHHAGQVLSRETIMEGVWNLPYDPSTNVVDVYMKYLRDKIDLPGERKLIRTVRGVGYVLGNE